MVSGIVALIVFAIYGDSDLRNYVSKSPLKSG